MTRPRPARVTLSEVNEDYISTAALESGEFESVGLAQSHADSLVKSLEGLGRSHSAFADRIRWVFDQVPMVPICRYRVDVFTGGGALIFTRTIEVQGLNYEYQA